MTDKPDWTDDSDVTEMIVKQFIVALVAARERTPDLVDGFVARRYALLLSGDGLEVIERQEIPVDTPEV